MSEPEVAVEIEQHYEQDYDESQRIVTGLNELELVRTREIIGRTLPPGPLRVLDIGGAAGVHARWLAAAGHTVDLVDPDAAPRRGRRGTRRRGLAVTAQLGDVRTLTQPDSSYDIVLMLGPLYHLTERPERVQAWRAALRAS